MLGSGVEPVVDDNEEDTKKRYPERCTPGRPGKQEEMPIATGSRLGERELCVQVPFVVGLVRLNTEVPFQKALKSLVAVANRI